MSSITQEYIQSLLYYKNGNLFWKVSNPKNRIKQDSKAGHTDLSTGYAKIGINKKQYYAHRLIFLYHHGYIPGYIDHINMNKLDNRIENLRFATKSQNKSNTRKQSNNSSGHKGVTFHKESGKWMAQIQLNGLKTYIGIFADKDEAANAYNEASIELFKKFHPQIVEKAHGIT